jgi:glycosyltransferase involved in cell wall biosynthesis
LEAATAGLYAAAASGASYSFSGHTLHQLDLMRAKLAHASFVTVGSEFERDVLCSRYGEDNRDRIHVRRLGVPPRPARAAPDKGLVVTAGTLSGKKGHDVLLRAFAEVDPDARLELVGEGPLRADLEALARELGVESRVRFHGALGYSETLAIIGRASVFALCCRRTPDGDHDCLPVALMDAMSLGVPVISSRAFGIPELIEDGQSGLLAPPEDPAATTEALSRLLSDDDFAGRIGAAGREVARERFDLERNTRALTELFAAYLA